MSPTLLINRLLKKGFFVILNEVHDIEVINMTRFFASLRMTHSQFGEFFNSLFMPLLRSRETQDYILTENRKPYLEIGGEI